MIEFLKNIKSKMKKLECYHTKCSQKTLIKNLGYVIVFFHNRLHLTKKIPFFSILEIIKDNVELLNHTLSNGLKIALQFDNLNIFDFILKYIEDKNLKYLITPSLLSYIIKNYDSNILYSILQVINNNNWNDLITTELLSHIINRKQLDNNIDLFNYILEIITEKNLQHLITEDIIRTAIINGDIEIFESIIEIIEEIKLKHLNFLNYEI